MLGQICIFEVLKINNYGVQIITKSFRLLQR